MELEEAIDHPVTATLAVVGSGLSLFQPGVLEALVGAIWASIGTIFTLTSLGAFTIPRVFPELSGFAGVMKGIFAGALVIYGLKLLSQMYQTFEERL